MHQPEPRKAAPLSEAQGSGAARELARLPLQVVKRGVEAPARPSGWAKWVQSLRFLPLALPLVMAGGLFGLYFQPPGLRWAMATLGLEPGGGTSAPIAVPARHPTPLAAQDTGPRRRSVMGLGRLLPEGDVITLSAPFGASDARLARLLVLEGDRVEAGAVLAVLDNERQFDAAVEAARAAVASRQAMVAQTRSATRAAREEAQAALARAESSAQNADRDFLRTATLRQRGFAADQAYEQRRTARNEATSEVEKLRATLSRYGEGPIERQADVMVAQRNLEVAEAELGRAEAELDKAYVRSPIAATVLSIANRPGERPSSGGMMNLGALDRMKVEVEVYQSRIAGVQLGQSVEVTAEALPQPLRGKVSRIGLEVGRQALVDATPAANTDARVIKVWASLDAPSTAVAARFINLQVTARIATGDAP